MSILVTGGAGFIGSHLVEALVERDGEVIVLDNFSIGKHNLPFLKKFNNVSIVEGDISDQEIVNDTVRHVSQIYHLAAMNRAPRSIENPRLSNEINVTGTINVLEAARKYEVDSIVFASSSSVYGRSEDFPRKETGKTRPAHPYGVGKLASEYYCDVYHFLYGIKIKILRYFAVYGPRQSPTVKYAAVIPIFIKNVLNNSPVTIYGDGTQTRNFTYVKDNVLCNIEAMESSLTTGKILNIASTREESLNRLIKLLEEIIGHNIEIIYEDWRIGDIKRATPDLELCRKLLGKIPENPIENGLRKTYEWFKNNPNYFISN